MENKMRRGYIVFPSCDTCARLFDELAHATRAHLQAVSALENAVRNDRIECVYAIERTLATAQKESAWALRQYRKHRTLHTKQRQRMPSRKLAGS